MADISMCLGRHCAARQSCYRFRAVADGDDQSYGNFDRSPIAGPQSCDYFWPVDQAEGALREE
jgi:hypothetical protein